MANITIIDSPTEAKIKKYANIHNPKFRQGYIYAFEYGDFVKIGLSRSPAQRFRQLAHLARGYGQLNTGRFAISIPCSNYIDLEEKLHSIFSTSRKEDTELFNIAFDEVVKEMDALDYLDISDEDLTSDKAKCDSLVEYFYRALNKNRYDKIDPISEIAHTDGCKIKVGVDMDWKCVSLAINHFEDDESWCGQPLSPSIAREVADKLLQYAEIADCLELTN